MDNRYHTCLAGKNALLINADAFDQMFIEGLLEQVEMELRAVESVAEAQALLEERAFHFILVDLRHAGDQVDAICRGSAAAADGAGMRHFVIGITDGSHSCDTVRLTGMVRKPIEPHQLFTLMGEALDAAAAPADSLPEGRHIDIAEGVMRIGGNRKAYARVLGLFAANQRDAAKAIRQSMSVGDLKTAQRAAHTIKGLSGSIGAKGLHEAAVKLDYALKADNASEAQALLPRFEQLLGEVIDEVDWWNSHRQVDEGEVRGDGRAAFASGKPGAPCRR